MTGVLDDKADVVVLRKLDRRNDVVARGNIHGIADVVPKLTRTRLVGEGIAAPIRKELLHDRRRGDIAARKSAFRTSKGHK